MGGGGLDRLHRRHARPHHQREFLGILAMVGQAERVGAKGDLDPGGIGIAQILLQQRADHQRLFGGRGIKLFGMLLGALIDALAHQHGRHQIGAILLEDLVAAGVGIGAMLDRIDTQRNRMVDRLLAMGMGSDLHAQAMGGIDHRLDLLVGHQLMLGIVADRHDPARGHDLDEVGALALQPAHGDAGGFRAVDHIVADVRNVGKFDAQAVDRVAMAAGRAERRARHPQARAGDDGAVDRFLERDDYLRIGAAVADRGEAGEQRVAHEAGRFDRILIGAARHRIADRVARVPAGGDMVMGVDQARQHGLGRQVDHLRAGRRDEARLDRGDAIVMDQDRHFLARGSAGAVDHPSGMDHDILGHHGRCGHRDHAACGQRRCLPPDHVTPCLI